MESITLAGEPRSARVARTFVRTLLSARGLVPSVAELITSELVSNVVLHARTELTVTISFDPCLRVEVHDGLAASDAFREILKGPPTALAPADAGGRGLALARLLASRLGVSDEPGMGNGKVVWFEVDRVAAVPSNDDDRAVVGRVLDPDVDTDRMGRIMKAIAPSASPDPATYPQRVRLAPVELLGVSGAGLTLMTKSEQGGVLACNHVVKKLEDLQFALGEGPGLQAFERGVPVLEPYLAHASGRWPFFGPAALELGVAAVFAFPLLVGVNRLGAFSLYRDSPGSLSDDELADTLARVDVATQGMVDLQAQGAICWDLFDPLGERARVHVATGMVSVQISSDMATALACIRGCAFTHDRSIFDVADDVIAGRLRLSRHTLT